MAGRDWRVCPPSPERAARLAEALALRPLTGQLLLNRGIDGAERAQRWLEPRLAQLRPPTGGAAMAGFDAAMARLDRALCDDETVGVFGDYDVDGVTSCALFASFLDGSGAEVVARVARREAGYGLGPAEVDHFADAGCALVVTCDCGTSDHAGLARARARGLDVIIVDHHQVPARSPDAAAFINPHQPGCRFPFRGLASVGVAFYLAAALRTRLRARGREAPDPRTLLDLVAVGTVADLAPLSDENRILVAAGLRRLSDAPRPGLRALCGLVGLPDGVRRAADIGHRLAPRLNAPGRLGAADRALALLLSRDDEAARLAAEDCELANRRRREVQSGVLEAALAEAEAQVRRGARALVCAGDGWHAGVVGIVAARLVDRFRRPAWVIGFDGDVGRGSGRSVPGYDLGAALAAAGDLLVRHGGHAAAAGLTVEKKQLDALRARLFAHAESGGEPVAPPLQVDAEIDLAEIDERLAGELARLEPFGIANPEPLLAVRGVLLERTRVVGDDHLQVTLRAGPAAIDGIGFGMAAGAPPEGARVRAAFLPELDHFRGEVRVRARLRDLAEEPA